MTALSIDQALNVALQHHNAGRLAEAQLVYRHILTQQPNNADVLHLLGVLSAQAGNATAGIELIKRAILLKPDGAVYHCNLSNLLVEQGRISEALAAAQQAILLKPDYAEAFINVGFALQTQGDIHKAIEAFRSAVTLTPSSFLAHTNLGDALRISGRLDEAINECKIAVQLNSLSPEAHNNLGNAYRDAGKHAEAVESYRKAVEFKPEFVEAQNYLGLAYAAQHRLEEAVTALSAVLQVYPDQAPTYNTLGSVLLEQGYVDRAVSAFRSAIRRSPAFPEAHSNLLYSTYFDPNHNAETILEEHLHWADVMARPLIEQNFAPSNDRTPTRRLRIGYISPNFCEHTIARFLIPLLLQHDHERFEIFAYSDTKTSDGVTQFIKEQCGHWRPIADQSDLAVAKMIRHDAIDILVDLTAHSPRNRMLVFARKPAPIQITHLAYPGTTGLETIDYRFTDDHLDPRIGNHAQYTERPLHIPTYWCYVPPTAAPSVNKLPAHKNGHITFGCLSNYARVSDTCIEIWTELLKSMPSARLLIHAHPGNHRDRVLKVLQEKEIQPYRVEFIEHKPFAEYLSTFNRVDISLDPFPFSSPATICDSLWMGVPVITLAGDIAARRAGVSLLNQVDLPHLITENIDQYISMAATLSQDLPGLSVLRASLRNRMEISRLCDESAYAHSIEDAYRSVWRRFCEGNTSHDEDIPAISFDLDPS